MRFLFFETFQYPNAEVTAKVDPATFADLPTKRRMVVPLALLLMAIGASCFTISDLFITHYALIQPLALAVAALGLIAGYYGGSIDAAIMRVADVQLSFPAILIALLIDGVARVALGGDRHEEIAIPVLVLSIG